jgi:hypothetical protein
MLSKKLSQSNVGTPTFQTCRQKAAFRCSLWCYHRGTPVTRLKGRICNELRGVVGERTPPTSAPPRYLFHGFSWCSLLASIVSASPSLSGRATATVRGSNDTVLGRRGRSRGRFALEFPNHSASVARSSRLGLAGKFGPRQPRANTFALAGGLLKPVCYRLGK